MPRRRRSRASTSSEHSVTSDNLNISDELPDVALETNNEFKRIDRKRFGLALAGGHQTDLETVDLTEDYAPTSPTIAQKLPQTKCEKEIDLSRDEISYPPKIPEHTVKKGKKEATKNQSDKKKDALAERQAKKQMREEERRAKMEYEEFNKIYKPGECLKHIQLEMDPDLINQWYMEDVKREVAALGVRIIQTPKTDTSLLVWTRDEPRMLVNDSGELKLSTVRRQCSKNLYIILASELYADENVMWDRYVDGGTVIMFGLHELMKNGRAEKPWIHKAEYTKALVDLEIDFMMQSKAEMVLVESSMELGLLVASYTRAIAEAPYKKAKREIDEQAEFYMRGDNKNCVTVDKDGNGLSRLWEQMIATLPNSSLEVARSLGAEYKSPRGLALELQSSGGMTRIAGIGVSRTNVPGGKTRKLGPEFTRKLHTLFTSEDGNKLID